MPALGAVGLRDVGAGYEDGFVPRTAAPLVGRVDELAALTRALDQAADGTASAVVLAGDAGVGKTRLLAEVISMATERGLLSVIGHCVDLGDAPPPYLPFSEAFARLAGEQPELIETLLVAHPAIERLLPGRAPHDADDRIGRGELFASVLAALTQLADKQPVVLLVEDVHWADQATRDLLGYLFARLQGEHLAVIASYRSDDLHRRHPLRPTLAEWARLPSVARVQLNPLGPEHMRALVRATEDAPLAESDVASIVRRADGNPFFAEELVAAAEQYAGLQQLPWQLADLLLVRLDRLSDAARHLVRVAAVAGRRVSHEILAAVADVPPGQLDQALREAFDAHILQVTPSGRGYTFRHALLAEAVYDDLLPGERVRLHAAYASVVAARDDRTAAELARHARASHDYATAYAASIRAGDAAMAVAAPREAMQHYEAALELADRVPAADDTTAVVVSLVDAAVAAGHANRGERLARQALDALPADAGPMTRAQLNVAVAAAAIDTEFDETPLRATAEALRLIGPEPTAFRARAAALHARLTLIVGQQAESERWAAEAIEIARALDRPAELADAQTTLTLLERRVKDPAEVLARLQSVADDAQAAGQSGPEIRSRYNLGGIYLEVGDLAHAQAAYEHAARRSHEAGRPWALVALHARAAAGRARYARGDWDGALSTLDTSGESPTAFAEARLTSAALAVRAGRGEAGVVETGRALRPWWDRESLVAHDSVLAMLESLVVQGRADDAAALIDEAIEFLSDIWDDEWFLARIHISALGVMACAAEAATSPDARRRELVERAASYVAAGRHTGEVGGSPARPLGLEALAWLARLDAEWARLRWIAGTDDAPGEEDHLAAWRDAVEAFGYGNVVEATRARVRYAEVLRAAGRTAEAAEQADLARAAARTMDARPILDDLRRLGSSAGPGRTVKPCGFEALTERENEVLNLLVHARTNRQIATQLYISEKTVSVHVSNILAKLEVRSRAEAAALARDRA